MCAKVGISVPKSVLYQCGPLPSKRAALWASSACQQVLLEYIGYAFYELDKPSALTVMEGIGREALVEAYQRHETTRESRSLLFCVQALIEALDLGESLKTYGLHCRMTHDEPRLYLISHASLEKRGLSIGQANIYQMLAPEHRLYLPFSLPQLLVDVNGKPCPNRRAYPPNPRPCRDWLIT